ncbi:unnamed protein product [Lathyrus sativus]|nr:unnamed protein product [Lathyrus sativus]
MLYFLTKHTAMSTQYFITLFFFFLISCHTITSTSSLENEEAKKVLDLIKKEKLSHLKFYWHSIASGNNSTSIEVVPTPKKLNSSTSFGSFNMIDNPLTLGPELSSKLVGKSQGFYVYASKEEFSLFMGMNFALIEGKYNGSSFTILGSNPISHKVREMPVIGGTGLFKLARGYAQVTTHFLDLKTAYAIDEYNVYVFHY